MADREGIARVREYLLRTVPDPSAGLEVRRTIIALVENHEQPAPAALLRSIHEFDRALIEGAGPIEVAARQRAAENALLDLEVYLESGNIAQFRANPAVEP